MSSAGETWTEAYIEAWRSNDAQQIGALFAEDARYLTSPDSEPRVGRAAIVAGWLEDLDEPETWSFEWSIIHEDESLVLVEGRTKYPAERDYLNLWVVRLDAEGRATEFTEWYMPRPHQD
ncbi:nuclear transport factor 2 family protein [Microbacterium sp. W4I20]|uniref:nuclear transport factor 2 family protein n=1 Tax=Microbacterium sp. W4I20 TaxID=3042262 RepID=UPI0027D8508E|nr:nuclear transport factor 2 family protein [Microbacterium sp. W4I20]